MMTRDGAGSRAEEGPAVVVVRVRSARAMVSPPGAARPGLCAGPSPAVPNIPRPELQVPCRIAAGRPILGGEARLVNTLLRLGDGIPQFFIRPAHPGPGRRLGRDRRWL